MAPGSINSAATNNSGAPTAAQTVQAPSTLGENVIQIADQLITQVAQEQTVAKVQPQVSKAQAQSFVKSQAQSVGEQARSLLPIKNNKLSTLAALNAIGTSNMGMLKALIKYDLVDLKQSGGRLLIAAITNNNFEVIDFLVSQARVDPGPAKEHLLKLVVAKGSPQLLSHLLHLNCVDVSSDDHEALRQAMQQTDSTAANLLLQSPSTYPNGNIPDISGVRTRVLQLISQNKMPSQFNIEQVLHQELNQDDVKEAMETRQSAIHVFGPQQAHGNFTGLSAIPSTPAATRSEVKLFIKNQIESARERMDFMQSGASSRTAGLAFIKAARSGETAILKGMAIHGLVKADPQVGLKALQGAVSNGHLENAYFLLTELGVDAGADRNSVLTMAVKTGNIEAVKLLSRFENVNPAEGDFRPLRLAIEMGNQEMVDAMLMTPSTYVDGRVPEIEGMRERVVHLITANAFPSTFDLENTLHAEMNSPFIQNAMAHRALHLSD